MTQLYIVRHGETKWNAEGRLQGWSGASLTRNGVAQIRKLKQRLDDVPFKIAYVSPLERTRRTATILLREREVPLFLEPQLKEIFMGDWEGKTLEEVAREQPRKLSIFWEAPDKYNPHSGETFHEVRKRVVAAVEKILSRHPKGAVLVVSHGCASKILLSHFEGRPLRKLWDPPKLKEASLSLIEANDGTAKILLYGDTSHLENGLGNE